MTRMSIENAIDGFLFHCQYEKNLSPKTLKAYSTDLKQFFSFVKETDMWTITKEPLKTYLQNISNFKPKTIKRKIASLKAMFNYIEFENDDFINPFRKIKVRFKEPFILPTVMTINEIKKLLSLFYKKRAALQEGTHIYKTQTRNIAIVELLFATGIRISELCNLKLENINIKNGVIKVFGKGSKERIIQICHSETISILKSYYKFYEKEIKKNTIFFVNRLGAPLSTQSVRLMIKKHVKESGLKKRITPHTFRHTFATLLLEEDVDIKYIQELLGHSSISITQIYTHVNISKQKKILQTKHPRRKFSLS